MLKVVLPLIGALLAGCGSSGSTSSDSPESQVEALVRAIESGDCESVTQVVLTPSAIDCALIEQAEGTFGRSNIDLDEAEFSSSEPVEDSAVVTVTWSPDLPGETFDVQRVDGVWKVVFDSDA